MILKPSDKWTWYYDDAEQHLMLDLGDDIVFRTKSVKKIDRRLCNWYQRVLS